MNKSMKTILTAAALLIITGSSYQTFAQPIESSKTPVSVTSPIVTNPQKVEISKDVKDSKDAKKDEMMKDAKDALKIESKVDSKTSSVTTPNAPLTTSTK